MGVRLVEGKPFAGIAEIVRPLHPCRRFLVESEIALSCTDWDGVSRKVRWAMCQELGHVLHIAVGGAVANEIVHLIPSRFGGSRAR